LRKNDGYAASMGKELRSSWVYTSEEILRIAFTVASVSTLQRAAPDLRNARFVPGRLRLWSL